MSNTKTDKTIVRIAGALKQITTVRDKEGKLLHKIIAPLKVEVHTHDVMQMIVGAAILAIPTAFTEESWRLGHELPILNIIGIMILALLFIAIFTYYNVYSKELITQHWDEFIKRVLGTYIVSLVVVAVILTLLEQAPWTVDSVLAIKRTILVAFPASMSAAVADMLK